MFVATTAKEIIAQFRLTHKEQFALVQWHWGVKPSRSIIYRLRKKHLVMPKHDVLTDAGKRVAARLAKP